MGRKAIFSSNGQALCSVRHRPHHGPRSGVQRARGLPLCWIDNPHRKIDMSDHHHLPPPDQALAEHPLEYSDPELAAYTDEKAQDVLEDVIAYMPIVLSSMAALQIFMFAFIAVLLA